MFTFASKILISCTLLLIFSIIYTLLVTVNVTRKIS